MIQNPLVQPEISSSLNLLTKTFQNLRVEKLFAVEEQIYKGKFL
jgi:hypothetical protein